MKKLILLLIAITTMISGCASFEAMFGTAFSKSRKNFDET